MKHASGKVLTVIGSTLVTTEYNDKSTNTEIYFASTVKMLYLLLHVSKKLNLGHQNFPNVNIVAYDKLEDDIATLPRRPDHLPYSPTTDNIQKPRKLIL